MTSRGHYRQARRRESFASGPILDVFEQQVLGDPLALITPNSIDMFAVERRLEQLAF